MDEEMAAEGEHDSDANSDFDGAEATEEGELYQQLLNMPWEAESGGPAM